MPLSTETEGLISLYAQKVQLDTKQLGQLDVVQNGYTVVTGVGTSDQIKIWGSNEVLDNYNGPIKRMDNKIIEINDQIKSLQNQVLSIGQTANYCGCGTMTYSAGFTSVTVYEDNTKYRGYSYNGNNPFEGVVGIITSGNIGIGTYNFIHQVAIGTYYDPIIDCNNIFLCTTEICAGYASSITELTGQISDLQTERNGIIEKVNFLKNARITPELQNYAYNESRQKINQSIGVSTTILGFLQDPANSEFL